MFQTFSGSSRRPRQVNLSGQEADPFAVWGGPPVASGIQKTVAAAQAERLQRQQERERLSASKRIQRVWRGHKSRRDLADIRRESWEDIERSIDRNTSQPLTNLEGRLRLLLAFFNARNPKDITRLTRLSDRLLAASQNNFLTEGEIRPYLLLLARAIIASLAESSVKVNENLLLLLALIVESAPEIIPKISSKYYEVVASIITQTSLPKANRNLLLRVIRAPLIEDIELENGLVSSGYGPFTLYILPLDNLSDAFGNLQELARIVNINLVSEALMRASRSTSFPIVPPQSRLWLLAHLINLHRLRNGNAHEPVYMRALSLLLSSCASEIVNRIDAEDSESLSRPGNDEEFDISKSALPKFVKDELITLVDKQSVTELLTKFNSEYDSSSPAQDRDDASLLASYALMLLRIFPRLGEEIRMWLYQGSVANDKSGTRIPALKFFWRAMSSTSTFSVVSGDAKSALAILRPRRHSHPLIVSPREDIAKERDWRAILLFLELYAFVLRFTDDEEFLNGAQSVSGPAQLISRSRESALPLQEVKLLSVFLKNLSFTMYFNQSEILGDGEIPTEGGLGSYFATGSATQFHEVAPSSSLLEDGEKRLGDDRDFLGIAGMTFNYVRSIVTRVMRMLYERDSRRRFLPNDHWLMTSRFDMVSFIPAVVSEEGRRHETAEAGEETEEDEEPVAPVHLGRRDFYNTAQRARRLQQSEQLSIQQKKAARKKMLAAVTPRLQILQHMPYAIPFETRVQIFRQFVYQDQVRRRSGRVDPDQWRMAVLHGEPPAFPRLPGDIISRHHAKIRRDQIFEDAYEQFYGLGEGLKEPIQITFVDKFDTVEAGIDGGGVTKEFLTSVTNEAFQSSTDLFATNDQNLLFPNPAAVDERRELLRLTGLDESSPKWRSIMQDFLRRYEFLGRIVGKCLYEGILVDIAFAGFFLLKWASTSVGGQTPQDTGYLPNINDLRDLDESLYQGLLQLKNYPGSVGDFALDFTINDTISMPGEPTRTITRNLLPNGPNFPVTNENRLLYVSLVARHRLHGQPLQQTRAFLRGLWDIINPSWLSMFNQAELQTLIGGDSSEINVEDLRRNTIYSGVYEIGDDGLEHPTVQMFWAVMKRLDDLDRRKVLKYVTSTPRAPLLGFTQLNPRFSIRDGGGDQQRLPSTSTCINLLKLPRYDSVDTLRNKLLYAVNSGAGFDLS